jgi:hypothetical protein
VTCDITGSDNKRSSSLKNTDVRRHHWYSVFRENKHRELSGVFEGFHLCSVGTEQSVRRLDNSEGS